MTHEDGGGAFSIILRQYNEVSFLSVYEGTAYRTVTGYDIFTARTLPRPRNHHGVRQRSLGLNHAPAM